MNFTTQQLVDFYSTNRPTPYTVAFQAGDLLGNEEDQVPRNIVDLLCDLIYPHRDEHCIPTREYPQEMAFLLEAYICGMQGRPIPSHLPSTPTGRMTA